MIDDIKAYGAVLVEPLGRPVDFAVSVPGSKSLANRALLLAGIAEGRSLIEGVPDSDDIRAALSALRSLGVELSNPASGHWEIGGGGLGLPAGEARIDVGSSGTAGRFLPGLLAAASGGERRLTASAQLSARPMAPLLEALARWGADIRRDGAGGSFPLRIAGDSLRGGRTEISARDSSQFASGLMLAGPLCPEGAELIIRDLDPDERYIDMTLALMRRFGVGVEAAHEGGDVRVAFRPQSYRAADLAIEPDFNSANYFLSLPLLVGGSAVVSGLPADSGQPGRLFLSVLSRLGARVEAAADGVRVAGGGPPLRGGFDVDMRAMSEAAPTLGVLAAFADRPIAMRNLGHIRGHETDRLRAMHELYAAAGVESEAGDDWIRVHPSAGGLERAAVDSRDDHRMAMSLALLGLAGEGLTIANPGAVAKTFPGFFGRLRDVGARIVPV